MIISFLFTTTVYAQSTGDFKTIGSGNWSSPGIWQRFNGSNWVNAIAPPTTSDGIITISSGDSITVTNNVDTTFADQVVINTGGILNVFQTPLFYLVNGPGTDMTVLGKLYVYFNSNIQNRSNGIGDPATILYIGDSLFQNGGISASITFQGTKTQTIFGTGYFNGSMTLNNANNLIIKDNNSFFKTTFVNGKIIVEGNFVISQYTSPFVGANSKRFIDGKIIFIMYEPDLFAMTIPMGIGDRYLPVTFKSQKNDNAETHYLLTLFNGAPVSRILPGTIDRLLDSRYLNITSDRPGNLVNASVQLNYDSLDHVTDASRLRIVKSDGSSWINVGGSGKGFPTGKITSSVNFNTLGDFVLANQSAGILPLNGNITSANLSLPDTYSLTTNADGKIQIRLNSKNNNPLSLTLLDGDSLTSLGSLNVNPNSTGLLRKDGLAKGIYYVRVNASNLNQPYNYTIIDSLISPVQANNIEPDSTTGLARTLLLNSETTGHIGYYYKNLRDTLDWYKLTTIANGALRLRLTSANSSSITLTLYNKTATTVLGSLIVPGNSTGTLTTPGLTAGKYFINIKCTNSNLFAPYVLADSLFPSLNLSTPLFSLTQGKAFKEDVKAYPNPTAAQTTILFSALKETKYTLKLMDVSGNEILRKSGNAFVGSNKITLDLGKYTSGNYLINLITDDGIKAVNITKER